MTLAREYLRVSKDHSGRARSITEQHGDNLAAGERHGFTLNGTAYSDVSISASRYGTKVRGGFARLVSDLEAGDFGAEVLVLWESSRGSRKVGEWANLVELLREAGVKVFVTTHQRLYDMANARDRRTLLEDAVDAAYQSDKASDAIRRATAAGAARGEPHGRIPYGYRRRYDERTRRLIAQEPEPGEAAVVRELFARLRKGHSLRAIERDFAARGIRTRTGKPFTAQRLGEMARRPVYAGLRVHEPGSRGGRRHVSLDGAVEGTWPALVDTETFAAVRAMLLRPERSTYRPGRGVHLLSMIAVCDVCGGPLAAAHRDGERTYVCHRAHHVQIGADALDAYAERVMLAYLARDDVIAGLRAAPDAGGELAAVRADLAEARAELAALRKAGRERRLTVATMLEVEPGLAARAAALEARERELSTPPELAGLIEPGKDVARRWRDAPMSARRRVARLLCSPRILGELRLMRTPRGHRADPEGRVNWHRG